jgi:hypothetical protein
MVVVKNLVTLTVGAPSAETLLRRMVLERKGAAACGAAAEMRFGIPPPAGAHGTVGVQEKSQ